MDINFKRDSVHTNRFNIEGIAETGDKKGIAGYHGGFIDKIIGWISCYILHKSVPVESKNKGVYYLNCKSLENLQKRIGAEPLKDIHNPKDVEAWLQQVKNRSVKPQETQITPTQQTRTIPLEEPTPEDIVPEPEPVVQKGPDNKINAASILKSKIRNIDDRQISSVKSIATCLEEYDQENLNKEFLLLYRSLSNTRDPVAPMRLLANEYFENSQFVRLEMIVKALEHIQQEGHFEAYLDTVDALIQNYKGKYSESEAKLPVTPKRILLEGAPKNHLSAEATSTIISSLEKEGDKFSSHDLAQAIRTYLVYADDGQALIALTKHFKNNNNTSNADRMIEALKNQNDPFIKDKLGAVKTYLQTLDTEKAQ